MNRATFGLATVLAFAAIDANAAQTEVQVLVDETSRLAGMKTYAFLNTTEPDNTPSAPRRREYFRVARKAIVDTLQKKGYTLVEEEAAEFRVEFSGMGVVTRNTRERDTGRISLNPVPGSAGEADITEGLLRVLVSLQGDDAHVWSVTGSLIVGSNPRQTERRIEKLVKKVFDDFPEASR